MKISALACIWACLLLVACVTHAKDSTQTESDDDYFRLRESSTGAVNKKAPVINPKKSVLPVGTARAMLL
jgi:hypothetical protein